MVTGRPIRTCACLSGRQQGQLCGGLGHEGTQSAALDEETRDQLPVMQLLGCLSPAPGGTHKVCVSHQQSSTWSSRWGGTGCGQQCCLGVPERFRLRPSMQPRPCTCVCQHRTCTLLTAWRWQQGAVAASPLLGMHENTKSQIMRKTVRTITLHINT